jgi:hypothetical protein
MKKPVDVPAFRLRSEVNDRHKPDLKDHDQSNP